MWGGIIITVTLHQQFSPLTNMDSLLYEEGVRGSAVGWDTALQVGRSRVRFLMVSDFFIDIILPAALWHWG